MRNRYQAMKSVEKLMRIRHQIAVKNFALITNKITSSKQQLQNLYNYLQEYSNNLETKGVKQISISQYKEQVIFIHKLQEAIYVQQQQLHKEEQILMKVKHDLLQKKVRYDIVLDKIKLLGKSVDKIIEKQQESRIEEFIVAKLHSGNQQDK